MNATRNRAIAGLHQQLIRLHQSAAAARELEGVSSPYFQERVISLLEQIAGVSDHAAKALELLVVEEEHSAIAAECFSGKAA